MDRSQRIIWSDNGVLKDVSVELNDFRRGTYTLPFVAAQDKLLIGSELPFNHKYFDVGTVNAIASTVSLEIWFGNGWVDAVDLVDETATSGVTLSKSGPISFSPDKQTSNWSSVSDTSQSQYVDLGLGTLKIYDLFWLRLSMSADVTPGMTLKYIGQRFSDDDDLDDFYPDLANANLKTAFEAGKTDWKAQSFAAADAITRELRRAGVIVRRDQIMRGELLLEASVHKTAEIIYGGLGKSYAEQRAAAVTSYKSALDLKFYEVDSNADGEASDNEKTNSAAFGTR